MGGNAATPAHRADLPEMTPSDSPLRTALQAAASQVRTTLAGVAGRVTENLALMSRSSSRIAERDLLNLCQIDLRRNGGVLQREFDGELGRRISEDIAPRDTSRRPLAGADWETLSLVDDGEVEERMFSDRIGQQISHACEAELRELAGYMGSLLQTGRADQDRNPLRAELLGAALYRAIERVSNQADVRKVLARELGAAMARAMPGCYAEILKDLQHRGVRPLGLTVRQVEGPGNQLPGINSAYATLSSTRSQPGELDAGLSRPPPSPSGHAPRSGRGDSAGFTTRSGPSTSVGGYARTASGAGSTLSPLQADAQLMALLRHLTGGATNAGASGPAAFDAPRRGGQGSRSGGLTNDRAPFSRSAGLEHATTRGPASAPHTDAAGDPGPAFAGDGITGLMAVNLIRAHREELLQASNGKLDHMVIDVVGSLFDQILSDSRVPPQMARQIARLQLPVLRVALSDASFFSSRRHPVRRFVNRIASLACAFEDFDEGPGKHFLARVSELVQEIVDGDFDQIELYTAKLSALEAFIAEQSDREAAEGGAVETLGAKETELRLQQRYMMQLQTALTPLALPAYLRTFLAQVWSQALVLATNRDGTQSDRATRYRRAGRDLVMSVQPKGSPALRKKFLMQLPPLMKDLNEGLRLVGWPEAAQREFFGKLLPAHAESLKGAAQSELDHNLMVKQLEGIFAMPVPGADSLSPADPVPEVEPEVIAQRFSAEEAERVGLVTESAVDWAGTVDIDLGDTTDAGGAATDGGAQTEPGDSAPLNLPGVDVDLSLTGADPAEPMRGPNLIDHVKLGFAYQMHLKDEWQKVRLTHVSPGRSFFVFTRGHKHQETISMTARMLARMCETQRFRAVESTYLMERATHRARKQLAALGAPTRS